MKRFTIAFALIVSLLSIAAAGFNGCGKGNSLTSITVTPPEPFIAKGQTQQLLVTSHFSDGKILLFWTQVTWQSSDTKVATVSSTGLVTAQQKEGTAVITAVDIAHPSITSSITVSVTDLTIAPVDATMSAGTSTIQFTATALFSGATPSVDPKILTESVLWTSSSNSVAEISNVTGSQGLATRKTTTGTTTITATLSGITATTTLTVN